ncbi:carbohydrate-binding module family 20 domain-containing protein [Cellulomonas sp. NPDC089187]|uniref:carbohydrate-binding module family 20 domain-containing protein n=1 Tax=Cellulomonas sp. NPDC089187 TaxID=3154970 RepID=UPI0034282D45
MRLSRRITAAAVTAVLACTGLAGIATPATATAPDGPGGQGNVILNLFQWTWDSVAAECTSTIGPAGFGYVQVSPPQETIRGTAWWTSYQPVSYKIESKLGTRAEFAAMVQTCEAAGVGVIVDAVINHTTGADGGSGTGVAGSSYGVDSFPGIYGAADFNDCRSNISNYRDRYQVQNCRLVSLQDLRTGSEYVRGVIAGYLNDLIGLGVSGFRIDAAKHIPAADLAAIKAKLTDPNVYWVQEVIGAAGEPITEGEYVGTGDVHEFDYARTLKSRFDGQIAQLRTIGDGQLPSAQAGVFVDNHDTERNGETMNVTWGAKYILANAFMLAYPYGSPSVYSGYRFTDKDAGAPGATTTSVPDANCSSQSWTCTQRWTEIAGMVGFHNQVDGTALTHWWDDGSNHIAFGRGNQGYVTINNSAAAVTRTYQTSLPAGTYCDVVASKTCAVTYTVSSAGTFTATVPAYGALALHVGARTSGGGTTQGSASFAVNASTVWGQNIRVVGSIPALGSWNPASGVALSSASYPVWRGTVPLPVGTSFEYEYVKVDGAGTVIWESGANRTATVGSSGTVMLNDTWRS